MFQNLTRNVLAVAVGTALAASSAHAFVVNNTFSGNWAETLEANVARGMIIDIYENAEASGDFAPAALVQWFTHRDGQPVWLFSNLAQIDPNTNSVDLDFVEFTGGEFAPDLVTPTDETWGTGTLTFNSCQSASLSYDGPDGTGVIEGLFNLKGENCVVDEVFDSCPDFSTAGPLEGSCVLEGEVSADITLTNETLWLLSGQVRVNMTEEPRMEMAR